MISFQEIRIQQAAGFEEPKSPESPAAVGPWGLQRRIKLSMDGEGLLSRGNIFTYGHFPE